MKNVIRTSLLLTLFAVCLTGCNSSSGRRSGGGGGGDQSQDDGEMPDDGTEWSGYDKFYKNKKSCFGDNVDDYHLNDTTGEELQKNIHHYLIDQHTTYLHYSEIELFYPYTEELDSDRGGYECFYTAYHYKDNAITREHMWCCANSGVGTNRMWYRQSNKTEWKMDDAGGLEEYWGGGSDIYQLRATTYEVNNKRQNYKYYVYGTGESYSEVKEEGAPYSLKFSTGTKTCEVPDYFKGDVARVLMYMYMHYNSFDNYDVYYTERHTPTYQKSSAVEESSTHTPYVCAQRDSAGKPTLLFSQIMNYSETESIQKLKEWNKLDPVSDLEKQRNKYVSNKECQGNRNPFVDYPQLVDLCFPD